MENTKKKKMPARLKTIYGLVLALAVSVLAGCSGGSGIGGASNSGNRPGTSAGSSVSGADGGLQVHFIDVGQADSALVLCGGESMLIDGGNVADSDLVYTYLEKLDVDHLDYVVCTHAHEDHVGGLSGALSYATADTAFSPVTDYSSKAFSNFKANVEKQGIELTVPSPGDVFELGEASVTVLGPINESDDPNNTSIVLRVVYGDTSFLFTGDAEREEEQDILNAGYTLKSTVLKVGHHGSDTSTSYPFLREVMPEYAVISVGTGNSYGHPTENTLSRLRDADVKVYRTDQQGDIICTSDGKNVTFETKRNEDANTLESAGSNSVQRQEQENGTEYILNTGTKKFHLPSCTSVETMKENNRESYTGNREDLIEEGYEPCGKCKP